MYSRSYHFIPANKPKLFDRSKSLGADRIIFDLEDAVPGSDKDVALESLRQWLISRDDNSGFYVRLNGCNGVIAKLELDLLNQFPEMGVVLPKIESKSHLQSEVGHYQLSNERPIIGLIESAEGLINLPAILELGVLKGIGLGLEDFLSDSVYGSLELVSFTQRIQSEIALQAMAHGIEAIDTISTDLSGGEQLVSDIDGAKSSGMTGKFSIHPLQISAINDAFAPDEALVVQARRHEELLNTASGDCGYATEQGDVLSPPKLKKLKFILDYLKYYGNRK